MKNKKIKLFVTISLLSSIFITQNSQCAFRSTQLTRMANSRQLLTRTMEARIKEDRIANWYKRSGSIKRAFAIASIMLAGKIFIPDSITVHFDR